MKDLGISTFNRFNHGSNYNPHGQYDYIFPKKLTIGADVPLESPNLWIKLWDFNISSAEGIKRALRTFHLQFDTMNLLSSDNLTSMHFEVSLSTMYGKLGYAVSKRYNAIDTNATHLQFDTMNLLSSDNLTSMHFEVSLSTMYGKLGYAVSKRYNAIDTNATSSLDEIKLHLFYRKEENYYHVKIYLRGMGGQLPVIYNARFWNMLGYDSSLDEIKLHLFYRKEENYYHVKIYLRGMGGQLPVIYNARFWNMLGYDKVDPQFFPSNTLTNGAYLQQTKWFIENTDCSRIDTEQLLSETEGYEHLVSQLADYKNTLTNGAYLQQTKWFIENTDCSRIDTEQLLSETEGYEHLVSQLADYKVGRNLLKGTLDFNKDFWQIPSDSTTQIIDGYTYFNFSKANRAPLSLNQTRNLLKGTLDFNKDFWQIPSDSTTQIIDGYTYFNFSKANRAPLSLNQTVKLADNHRYTISFDAKSAKRAEISFELYAVGDGTDDLSIKPITFMLDEKIRRYSVDFHVSAKVLKHLTLKPVLSSDQSIDAIGGGVKC